MTLTLIIGIATIITLIVFWLSFLFSEDSEGAGLVALITGILLTTEIIFLLVKFVKWIWFL